jgi:hypothetical protein
MYLPLGTFRKSYLTKVYKFTVSTANLVINPMIILSNQKSTACVNLLLTCCNCVISTGCHYKYIIYFFSFNNNSHSCNRCGNSKKTTSCKFLKTYLSRYLCGVYLGFLLSYNTNSSSFVLNHLSISTFVGFHLMIIPFYAFILCVVLQ